MFLLVVLHTNTHQVKLSEVNYAPTVFLVEQKVHYVHYTAPTPLGKVKANS